MGKKERHLPKPPTTPFGRKKGTGEQRGDAPLMADEMAMAMAEGKIEEFIEREMPDNEYARKLASMMMGMTGMALPAGLSPDAGEETSGARAASDESVSGQEATSVSLPPEDVIRAAQAGDVEGLRGLLEREYRKRIPVHEGAVPPASGKANDLPSLSSEEKETVERLMKIASENDLSLDWIVLRAFKLYVLEYQRSGRL